MASQKSEFALLARDSEGVVRVIHVSTTLKKEVANLDKATEFAERMRSFNERFDCIKRLRTRKRRPGPPLRESYLIAPCRGSRMRRGRPPDAMPRNEPQAYRPRAHPTPRTATRMRRGEVVIRAVS
jgi:hypothetical protein